ncbi:MAG TPA: hypothetical protein VFX12_07100 [Vicinamibacterales bacterium]|nr:hypothetical protein [Vicinamibacterales bacterium]
MRNVLSSIAKRRVLAAALAIALTGGSAAAQTPDSSPPADSRGNEIQQEQAAKAAAQHAYVPNIAERTFLSIEDHGGFGAVRPLSPAFVGIKAGSGLALGVASGRQFSEGDVLQATAAYSIRNYKMVEGAYRSRPLAGDRLSFSGRVRWQDATAVAFYGLGPATPHTRADYRERKTEASVQARLDPVRFIELTGGTGYEHFNIGPGTSNRSSVGELFTPVQAPGLEADPTFLHSVVSAAFDTRASPGYSRSGTLLRGLFHDYRDRNGGPYSFQAREAIAQQLVPILHGNWVLDFEAHLWTTKGVGGDTVPYFLMPTLGGGTFLRGFGNYRFRDRNALLLTGEYRWYVQEYVDGVIFYDAGKVAPTLGGIDLSGLEHDYGAGVNFHSTVSTVLRIQVARSREGTRLILGFSPPAF